VQLAYSIIFDVMEHAEPIIKKLVYIILMILEHVSVLIHHLHEV